MSSRPHRSYGPFLPLLREEYGLFPGLSSLFGAKFVAVTDNRDSNQQRARRALALTIHYKRKGIYLLDDLDLALLALRLGPAAPKELAERMKENRGKIRTALSSWRKRKLPRQYINFDRTDGRYALNSAAYPRVNEVADLLLDLREPPAPR